MSARRNGSDDGYSTPPEGAESERAQKNFLAMGEEEMFALYGNPVEMSEREWRALLMRFLARSARASERAEAKAEAAAMTASAGAREVVAPIMGALRSMQHTLKKVVTTQSETNSQVASLRADVMGYELHRATDVVERTAAQAQLQKATEDANAARRLAEEAARREADEDAAGETTGRYALEYLRRGAEMALVPAEKRLAVDAGLEKERIRARRMTVAAVVATVGTIISAAIAAASAFGHQ